MTLTRWFVAAAILGILTTAQAQEPQAPAEDKKPQELGIVLDLERPSDTDVLLLRNGDKLTGTILNESFSIRTSYASLKFSNRMIAGIDLEGGANNIEAIVTVNNNRFSGFIDDSGFVFKLQTGPQIQIRREKVLKAIFRVREEERKGIPQRQFLVLKNGDYFSGRILNSDLMVQTTYAKVPLNLNDAESVRLIGGQNPLTKILMRNNDMLQGVLETEDIAVELDVGPKIDIYQDRIDIFYCRDGFIPDLAHIRTAVFLVRMSLSKDGKFGLQWEKANNGMRIKEVTDDPAKTAGFQPGDIIVKVNGKPITSEEQVRGARDAVYQGKSNEAMLLVVRGEDELLFRIVR